MNIATPPAGMHVLWSENQFRYVIEPVGAIVSYPTDATEWVAVIPASWLSNQLMTDDYEILDVAVAEPAALIEEWVDNILVSEACKSCGEPWRCRAEFYRHVIELRHKENCAEAKGAKK